MKPFGWKRAIGTAERVVADAKRLSLVVEAAIKKLNTHSAALGGIFADLQLIFRMVRAWLRGEYQQLSNRSLVLLVGALVYFLMPIDAIPDFIPGIGFLDDAGVIAMALAAVKAEVDRFKAWEAGG
jgi:uncharacterized membrane protein YkvA (DUF1232 family)